MVPYLSFLPFYPLVALVLASALASALALPHRRPGSEGWPSYCRTNNNGYWPLALEVTQLKDEKEGSAGSEP